MKKLCALLLTALICFSCFTACGRRSGNGAYNVDNTEKLILYSLLNEVEEIVGSDEYTEVILRAQSVLDNRAATSSEVTQITEELQKLKEEYLNKAIVFVDSALERFVKKSLGKAFVDFVTVAEARSVTELDFTYNAENTEAMLQISNVDDFAHFPKLKKLVLKNNKITDISALSMLTELTELDVSQNEITDLAPLSGLEKLTKLSFAKNKVESLDSMGDCLMRLTELDASDNPLSSFGALQTAVNLVSLKLDGYTFSSFEFIYSLEKIETLSLCRVTLQEQAQLKNLIYIKNLDISQAVGISTADLALLTGLKTLIYRNSGLTDASFIAAMTNLVSIDFSQNSLKQFTFPPTVQGLRSVNLSQNSLETLSVPSFPGLEELDASKNRLQSFVSQNQPALKALNLSSNMLAQIDFSSFHALQTLDMGSNEVVQTSFISSETLKELSLENNGVVSFDAYAPSLQILNIAQNAEFLPSSLNGRPLLTSLNLLGSSSPSDLSFLSSMTELRELSIDLSALSDKSLPAALSALEEVFLAGADDTAIASLNAFSRLKTISVVSGDLSAPQLGGLKYLTFLSIHSPTLADISGIKNLESLAELSVTGATLPSPTVSGFAKLKRLTIVSSAVESFSHIENLPSLQYLNLSHNAPKSFIFALLPSLSYLSLSSCGISHISDFYLSVTDCVIVLANNNLTELSGLLPLRKVLTLDVSENPVSDYSALDGITVTNVIK